MADRMSRPKLVKKLMDKWGTFYQQYDYLHYVAIGEGERLRGIQNSRLKFEFPMTVLCGPNSTGKTTFLALSVLAFHDSQSLTLSGSNKGYYDFSYFFGF